MTNLLSVRVDFCNFHNAVHLHIKIRQINFDIRFYLIHFDFTKKCQNQVAKHSLEIAEIHSHQTFYHKILGCKIQDVSTMNNNDFRLTKVNEWFNQNHLKSSKVIWSLLKSFEVSWSILKSFEIIWSHLKSCEVIWSHIKSCEVIWNHLKSIEIIWNK